jgi:hypothetical protein
MPRSAPAGPPPEAAPAPIGGNRTDLTGPPAVAPAPAGQPNGQQPVAVPTGLPYGENQQLQQAQQAVHLPGAAPAPAAGPAPAGPGSPLPQGALQAAQQYQMPQLPPLERDSERPNEPVTAGLPSGPGPGPSTPGSPGATGLSDLLGQMAKQSGSVALSQLAQRAQALGS